MNQIHLRISRSPKTMKVSFKFLFSGIVSLLSAISIFSDGLLTVKTEPEGIEIWLDDQFVGDSPIIDKKLKAGRYSLKLVDPVQHSSTIEEVFIQENETTIIEKTLKSKFGTLKINSAPEGAQVSIYNELGNTPLTNNFMNPGKYRIEFRHPNKMYKSAIEDVVIPRGESITVSKALEKKKALDSKAVLRLVLGAGTAAGYIWAIIEQGHYKEYRTKYDFTYKEEYNDKQNTAAVLRTLGIIGGSLCLVGLEITAFF